MIKSRRIWSAEFLARTGKMRGAFRILVEGPEGKMRGAFRVLVEGPEGKMRGAFMVLVEGPEGKILLGRLRLRFGINIKMDLQGICWGQGLVDLSQDMDKWHMFVNVAMVLRVPKNVGNFSTNWRPVSFSGKTLVHWVGLVTVAPRSRSISQR